MNGKQLFCVMQHNNPVHFLSSLVLVYFNYLCVHFFQADAAVYKVGYPEYLRNEETFADRYHLVGYLLSYIKYNLSFYSHNKTTSYIQNR